MKSADAIERLFEGLPDDPRARLRAAVALQQEFRRRAARAVQPAIAQLLRAPPPSYAEMQALAAELNSVLQDLGLALSCTDPPQPCGVTATRRSAQETTGWLRLQSRGTVQHKSPPATELARLDVIEAPRVRGAGRGL
jgi:hypothetical protein